MPIGTVYRPPPRKRSSSGLADSNSTSNSGSLPPGAVPSSPSSPSLPTGRGKSDLEARIAEFSSSAANSNNPTTAILSPDTTTANSLASPSAALPPKSPVGTNHRQSVPLRPHAASTHDRSQPASAPNTAHPPIPNPPTPQTYAAQEQPSAAAQPYNPPPHNAYTQQSGATAPPNDRHRNPVPASRESSDTESRVKTPSNSTDMGKQTQSTAQVTNTAKVLIVYYSMYGHVRLLADSVRQGVESVEGCTAEILRVPETLNKDVLQKMNAPPKHEDPELTHDSLHKLGEADGVMFGIPTRFGMMPAQMKAMFDSTVKLWTKGDLVGKPAGLFFSSATQGGGQETTALTTITQLVHHGMIYVPPGYSFGGAMFDNSEVHGGSPYGCGTIANGDGSRLPSKYELDFARHQGAQFALVARKLAQ